MDYRTNTWCIDDVMDYFGELFDQAEHTQKKVREVFIKGMIQIDESHAYHNYFAKMNKMRDELIKIGKDVPFRAVYHKKKEE